ncbi:LemA family protein [Microbulbifer sp. SSSA002]|uniref:LemA family protein n=1 Tax=Microbulbifer sp. SSSA002 TaxID=3243376 RepID=UPI0040391C4C
MGSTGFIVLLGVAALFFYIISIFNKLVSLKNRSENAFAQIEIQLKRRHELIPNLVESARAYLNHERETLEAVISARSSAISDLKSAAQNPTNAAAIDKLGRTEGLLNGALSRLNMVIEAYPELKADQTLTELNEELNSTENRVAFARQAFNDCVTSYNIYKQSFPPVFLAGLFGHRADAKLLEFSDSETLQVAPRIEF